ncbi:MAG: hypothetical protein H6935_15330 [Thiobacillus sp.]|jgi:hypothetical protein|nr:hypothetical protein [Thiobacillus sp.]
MLNWLKRIWADFKAWQQANAEAHARSTPHSCCSAPPPGAGRHDTQYGR